MIFRRRLHRPVSPARGIRALLFPVFTPIGHCLTRSIAARTCARELPCGCSIRVVSVPRPRSKGYTLAQIAIERQSHFRDYYVPGIHLLRRPMARARLIVAMTTNSLYRGRVLGGFVSGLTALRRPTNTNTPHLLGTILSLHLVPFH